MDFGALRIDFVVAPQYRVPLPQRICLRNDAATVSGRFKTRTEFPIKHFFADNGDDIRFREWG